MVRRSTRNEASSITNPKHQRNPQAGLPGKQWIAHNERRSGLGPAPLAPTNDNAAIAAALKANPGKRHIVTDSVEHSSVLNYCIALEKEGYRVTYLPDLPAR